MKNNLRYFIVDFWWKYVDQANINGPVDRKHVRAGTDTPLGALPHPSIESEAMLFFFYLRTFHYLKDHLNQTHMQHNALGKSIITTTYIWNRKFIIILTNYQYLHNLLTF